MSTVPTLPLRLRAGHLTMMFEPETAFLRRICAGRHEIIRCIYAAVRDRNWGTVPARVLALETSIGEDSFDMHFDVSCKQGEIDFEWSGTISGSSDGVVWFDFNGEALSAFLKNRIGFCVLHPPTCAGMRAWSETPGELCFERRFPDLVEPQIFGYPPFGNMRLITHEFAPERWSTVELAGDVFEMEDQRNWTDASFKTYCTPLAVPFPVKITAGTHVHQSIILHAAPMDTVITTEDVDARPRVGLTVPTGALMPLPDLGVGVASHSCAMSGREKELLGALQLSHWRLDIDLSHPAWQERLLEVQRNVPGPLELALHLPRIGGSIDLRRLPESLVGPLKRILVFRDGEPSTSPATLALAREHLALLGVPIGCGTNAHFCELNRDQAFERCKPSSGDFVFWPMTPQVHAFDELSIIENLEGQAPTVRTARAFAGSRPLCVTPVTLKPRFNAVATGAIAETSDLLPLNVDPRQRTLFAAAWTLGSLAELTREHVSSATYFETVGWGGVMERESGSPLPELFPSDAGEVYPVYFVFRALAGFRSAIPLELPAGRVAGLYLVREGMRCMLVANLTGQELALKLSDGALRERAFSLSVSGEPGFQPTPVDGSGVFHLGPYGLARVEL